MIKKLFTELLKPKRNGEGFITVQLNDKIMPIYRGFYEDNLDEYLNLNNWGQVTGGGTMLAGSGEILYCNIDVLILFKHDINMISSKVIEKLEELGAPKGSKVLIEGMDEPIHFGKNEGLAIYLDGVNLSKEIYEKYDSNFVLSELSRLIGYTGEVQRYWEGKDETAFYFYSVSFEKMNSAISEFVNTYPLCKGARIMQIA